MRTYPKENAALQERIANTGMVLSQFLPKQLHENLLSDAKCGDEWFRFCDVVIEADWKSGARMQARLALEHGRQVF